jgi:hypothetical protein
LANMVAEGQLQLRFLDQATHRRTSPNTLRRSCWWKSCGKLRH